MKAVPPPAAQERLARLALYGPQTRSGTVQVLGSLLRRHSFLRRDERLGTP